MSSPGSATDRCSRMPRWSTDLLLEARSRRTRVLERDREGLERRVGVAADDGGDHRRVEAAAQVGADRHVRAQHAEAHGVDQQRPQLLRVVGLGRSRSSGSVVELPVRPGRATVRPRSTQRVAGRQLPDRREDRARRRGAPERQDLVEALQVERRAAPPGGPGSPSSPSRRRTPPALGVVERLLAEAVARRGTASRGRASQRANAHWPLKRLTQLGPVLAVRVQDDLGVRARREAVAALRDQLLAQLDVVVDLAVERDPQRPSSVRIGWAPPARSMMDRRVCPRPQGPSVSNVCASGPRWRSVAVIARRTPASAGSPARFTNPAIPHMEADALYEARGPESDGGNDACRAEIATA